MNHLRLTVQFHPNGTIVTFSNFVKETEDCLLRKSSKVYRIWAYTHENLSLRPSSIFKRRNHIFGSFFFHQSTHLNSSQVISDLTQKRIRQNVQVILYACRAW